MKLREALELRDGLREAGRMKLPVKAAYRVVKAVERLGAESRHFDALRKPLFEKYGEEPEKERIAPEYRDAFFKELDEILELEVELPIEPFLRIEEFGEQLIAPEILAKLGPVVLEE